MASFSERIGITSPKSIQLESLDSDTRYTLWNLCRARFFDSSKSIVLRDTPMYTIAGILYINFYKLPIDNLPHYRVDFTKQQLKTFEEMPWYELLNLIEFFHNYLKYDLKEQKEFASNVNAILEREKSAYRFIAGTLVPITNDVEMSELERAADYAGRFAPLAEHVHAAIELYAKKPDGDYRNSIKESISAVESAVRIISGKNDATLGDALKIMDAAKPIHTALKLALLKLYGYTSDEGGIRHSMLESANIDESDARFMLVACSAFVNYFVSRS